jgi:hypothetical protein
LLARHWSVTALLPVTEVRPSGGASSFGWTVLVVSSHAEVRAASAARVISRGFERMEFLL